ncbi:hypothetical protein GDO81_007597 [Engystomops pustulosus]|uniref:Uncharacterized protein n=1 Tax=Engystomops pustulosus TaxID=76066 RepID=A0AAV7C8E9_ENGPU|nr:hypothetical protein GDO81_007597 [Engystomops pustulosus]
MITPGSYYKSTYEPSALGRPWSDTRGGPGTQSHITIPLPRCYYRQVPRYNTLTHTASTISHTCRYRTLSASQDTHRRHLLSE